MRSTLEVSATNAPRPPLTCYNSAASKVFRARTYNFYRFSWLFQFNLCRRPIDRYHGVSRCCYTRQYRYGFSLVFLCENTDPYVATHRSGVKIAQRTSKNYMYVEQLLMNIYFSLRYLEKIVIFAVIDLGDENLYT